MDHFSISDFPVGVRIVSLGCERVYANIHKVVFSGIEPAAPNILRTFSRSELLPDFNIIHVPVALQIDGISIPRIEIGFECYFLHETMSYPDFPETMRAGLEL